MDKPAERGIKKAVDSIQETLADYGCKLNYDGLSPDVIHVAKVRVIDTLGVLIGGFFAEPSRIARDLAAQMSCSDGATIIGTRFKTMPDMAAFANASTARYADMTDSYQWPGSAHGHPSDVITPLLAVGECGQISGPKFITGVVLGYEVYCRISDVFHNRDQFDHTNIVCLAVAVAAGKLMDLTSNELSQCISMATVPNNILRQVRGGHLSMFKAVASGQAGRAGVFAAMLARAGMEGPHLPFEGKAGWCNHIARERFSLSTMGGDGIPFKILDTRIKYRAAAGTIIPCSLAAEKVAPLKDIKQVKKVIVEVFKRAKMHNAIGEQRWNPASREDADHSAPYVIAATLIDGKLALHSFDDAHLWNTNLRTLMQKIEIVENEEFTRAYERMPQKHHARITVEMNSGERLIGETGDDQRDHATEAGDEQIEDKFRGLTEDVLGTKQTNAALHNLWHLEQSCNIAKIPPAFALD